MKLPHIRPMVRTRYAGPTDARGSRVIATHVTTKRRKVIPWNHAFGAAENHCSAAAQLMGREPESMCSEDGGGYLFAFGAGSNGMLDEDDGK